jgi:glycosyltransferase involved in cell wall biosynthesis
MNILSWIKKVLGITMTVRNISKPEETTQEKISHVRALFILKRRQDYSTDIPNFREKTVATGMWNSAKYVAESLNALGATTSVIVVTDNNDIDREVTKFKATHVFIEGYWVVPEKFDVLKPLHKNVKWIIRCHSEIPFLSQEGIAFAWTAGYLNRGLFVSGNSQRNTDDLRSFARGLGYTKHFVPFLPNSYPDTSKHPMPFHHTKSETYAKDTLDVGCFGAIRPLKNQLAQAIAAYEYASQRGKKLRFHINTGRIEMQGMNAYKNLVAFFEPLEDAELVEHPWCNFNDFIQLMQSLDVLMQVSFTETFNIVAADALYAGTPVVGSAEIPFLSKGVANPTSTKDIVAAISRAVSNPLENVRDNRHTLLEYTKISSDIWKNWLAETK